jgi:glucose/arabinose dehydrogenase
MKILRRIIIGLLGLIVVGVIIVKLFVGAINVPVVSRPVEPGKLEERVQLPPGFQLSIFAKDIPGARMLRFTRKGDLLVSVPGRDEIVLLQRDSRGNNTGRKILLGKTLLGKTGISDFKDPQGMDFYQDKQHLDWLYVAESESIGRIQFDHNRAEVTGNYQRIITHLPGGGNHWKKTLRFGSDGLLYVAIGSSCNVCIEKDKRRASILRYQPDGSDEEIYASGLRNSEGFDWSPRDGALYATDNGRDLLGDNFPPCEFNKIEQGKFYGWPFANGNKVKDPDYGEGHDAEIAGSLAPVHGFRAHNAPLGMTFIHHANVPDVYKGAALVALHGSWNRSKKDGYKVVSLHWQEDGGIVEKDFVSGFLKDDSVIGRPVDVAEGPDGAVYISDDFAGVIYRVAYYTPGVN